MPSPRSPEDPAPHPAEVSPPRVIDDPLITTFGRLLEASSKLEQRLGAAMQAGTGLPHVWFEVLIRLARSEGGRLTMGSLAGDIALTTGGVTRLIDRMRASGYVERLVDPADRRVAYAVITGSGREILDRTAADHAERLREVFAGFDGASLSALDGLLDRLREVASRTS
ncbi:MarR family winged helix-turn-helix transcriptional regulator [Streptomyces sp. NBC_00102]|uniref:MarR family winged helix-turn-helix transcriptional regulator n=1 Tax=Streptomyces sp. NBC_00102 TaxID=2975652 RepID=UPI00225652D3|nr:MarR family winged helix-turn-helix transcriptional regulator [Streptomyces sp. NBC_00102]MCX5396817.1 MarR family winged helix-turn-helix transcriptional regulator [Streptomyces sp. NBC_00102]